MIYSCSRQHFIIYICFWRRARPILALRRSQARVALMTKPRHGPSHNPRIGAGTAVTYPHATCQQLSHIRYYLAFLSRSEIRHRVVFKCYRMTAGSPSSHPRPLEWVVTKFGGGGSTGVEAHRSPQNALIGATPRSPLLRAQGSKEIEPVVS